ncbi:MAG: hypothetical protein GXO66_06100 [Euryarchaeota archaeon]|nr:hypothetical protein [Euryarchaeota archaeon]
MYVVKASGRRERFSRAKVERTLRRAGAGRKLAAEIARRVEEEARDGITTSELYRRIMEMLESHPGVAQRYSLKKAIMRLGPSGYPFETYLARVLQEYGYSTQLRVKLRGECVTHEVDIIAARGRRRAMVEVKFHNSPGTYIDLKEAMYTYARFLDTRRRNSFTEAWLSCNTRTSPQAREYAECVGLRLLCWKYPPGRGLERLIDGRKLYPITALRGVDGGVVGAFSRAGYMLIKDLLDVPPARLADATGLPRQKLERLVELAREAVA